MHTFWLQIVKELADIIFTIQTSIELLELIKLPNDYSKRAEDAI